LPLFATFTNRLPIGGILGKAGLRVGFFRPR
jgi:hypothetical protein